MKFILRADANVSIGSGHVMRSIPIVEELIERGFSVDYIGDTGGLTWLENIIKNVGFEKIYKSEDDFQPNKSEDVLIFDSYHYPEEHQFINIEKWKFLIIVADSSTPNYFANLKLFPSIQDINSQMEPFKILSGSKFVPIRKGVHKIDQRHLRSNLEIVVVGGGIDKQDFVPAMSYELNNFDFEFNVNFFTNNPNALAKNKNFRSFKIGHSLVDIGNRSGLIFTTASTTSLEFIARGCAVGIACAVNNQESNYQFFSKIKVAHQIGRFENNKWNFESNQIKQLLFSVPARVELSEKANFLLDLNGSKRVVDEILKF